MSAHIGCSHFVICHTYEWYLYGAKLPEDQNKTLKWHFFYTFILQRQDIKKEETFCYLNCYTDLSVDDQVIVKKEKKKKTPLEFKEAPPLKCNTGSATR